MQPKLQGKAAPVQHGKVSTRTGQGLGRRGHVKDEQGPSPWKILNREAVLDLHC